MNIFTKLFKKEPVKQKVKTITTCSKHGVIYGWDICVEGKTFPTCWYCVGEFASQYVTRKTIEDCK